ncbi:MAG: hypothetical protein AB1640_09005 [bacterium]
MMRSKSFLAMVTALVLGLSSTSAFAGGWGPYFSWGRDDPSAGFPDEFLDRVDDFVPRDLLEDADLDFTIDHLTFGVVYDSAPSRASTINYRGTLGFDIAINSEIDSVDLPQIGEIDLNDVGLDMDESGYGFTTTHTLGFGLVQTELLKWWVGPGLRFNFNYYSYEQDVLGFTADIEAANLVIGGGLDTGVNLHLSPNLSLSLGGGFHWNAFGYVMGDQDIDFGALAWGDGPFYFIQVAALFHTGPDKDAWAASPAAQP